MTSDLQSRHRRNDLSLSLREEVEDTYRDEEVISATSFSLHEWFHLGGRIFIIYDIGITNSRSYFLLNV